MLPVNVGQCFVNFYVKSHLEIVKLVKARAFAKIEPSFRVLTLVSSNKIYCAQHIIYFGGKRMSRGTVSNEFPPQKKQLQRNARFVIPHINWLKVNAKKKHFQVKKQKKAAALFDLPVTRNFRGPLAKVQPKSSRGHSNLYCVLQKEPKK